MRAGLHRGDGEIGVGVGVGGDHREVGPRGGERRFEIGEHRIALQVGVVGVAGPVDQPHDRCIGVVVMGKRMGQPHIAEAGDQNTGHLTAPDVMPRINCREKMT